MRFHVLAAALALAAAPALAQQVQQPPAGQAAPPAMSPEVAAFVTFANSPEYLKHVTAAALGGDKDIDPSCATTKIVGRAQPLILRIPVFKEGSPYPAEGKWRDQYKVDRCGKPVIHNVLVEARAGRAPLVRLMMPGETGALDEMQAQVLQVSVPNAMAKLKCKDEKTLIVTDTRKDKIVTPPKADAQGKLTEGKWQEIWTFRACGKTVDLPVVYSADGKGGTMVSNDAKAEKKK